MASSSLPREILLPEFLKDYPVWLEFARAADELFQQVDADSETLRRIRETIHLGTVAQIKILQGVALNEEDLTRFDRELLIRSLNLVGCPIQDYSPFSDEQIFRMLQHLPTYWYSKGSKAVVDFISFVLGVDVEMIPLWSQDYLEFYVEGDAAIGNPVYRGGTWYPTSHVQIGFDPFRFNDMTLRDLVNFFKDMVNYNLVLYRLETRSEIPVAQLTDTVMITGEFDMSKSIALNAFSIQYLVMSNDVNLVADETLTGEHAPAPVPPPPGPPPPPPPPPPSPSACDSLYDWVKLMIDFESVGNPTQNVAAWPQVVNNFGVFRSQNLIFFRRAGEFDGSSHLVVDDSEGTNIGEEDFCVEGSAWPTALQLINSTTKHTILDFGNWRLQIAENGTVEVYDLLSDIIVLRTFPSHVGNEPFKYGIHSFQGITRLLVNDVVVNEVAYQLPKRLSGSMFIGRRASGGSFFTGLIGPLRVTQGLSRYIFPIEALDDYYPPRACFVNPVQLNTIVEFVPSTVEAWNTQFGVPYETQVRFTITNSSTEIDVVDVEFPPLSLLAGPMTVPPGGNSEVAFSIPSIPAGQAVVFDSIFFSPGIPNDDPEELSYLRTFIVPPNHITGRSLNRPTVEVESSGATAQLNVFAQAPIPECDDYYVNTNWLLAFQGAVGTQQMQDLSLFGHTDMEMLGDVEIDGQGNAVFQGAVDSWLRLGELVSDDTGNFPGVSVGALDGMFTADMFITPDFTGGPIGLFTLSTDEDPDSLPGLRFRINADGTIELSGRSSGGSPLATFVTTAALVNGERSHVEIVKYPRVEAGDWSNNPVVVIGIAINGIYEEYETPVDPAFSMLDVWAHFGVFGPADLEPTFVGLLHGFRFTVGTLRHQQNFLVPAQLWAESCPSGLPEATWTDVRTLVNFESSASGPSELFDTSNYHNRISGHGGVEVSQDEPFIGLNYLQFPNTPETEKATLAFLANLQGDFMVTGVSRMALGSGVSSVIVAVTSHNLLDNYVRVEAVEVAPGERAFRIAHVGTGIPSASELSTLTIPLGLPFRWVLSCASSVWRLFINGNLATKPVPWFLRNPTQSAVYVGGDNMPRFTGDLGEIALITGRGRYLETHASNVNPLPTESQVPYPAITLDQAQAQRTHAIISADNEPDGSPVSRDFSVYRRSLYTDGTTGPGAPTTRSNPISGVGSVSAGGNGNRGRYLSGVSLNLLRNTVWTVQTEFRFSDALINNGGIIYAGIQGSGNEFIGFRAINADTIGYYIKPTAATVSAFDGVINLKNCLFHRVANHFAAMRNGDTYTIAVNGILQEPIVCPSTVPLPAADTIGYIRYFNGVMSGAIGVAFESMFDNVVVTMNEILYTQNFVPPRRVPQVNLYIPPADPLRAEVELHIRGYAADNLLATAILDRSIDTKLVLTTDSTSWPDLADPVLDVDPILVTSNSLKFAMRDGIGAEGPRGLFADAPELHPVDNESWTADVLISTALTSTSTRNQIFGWTNTAGNWGLGLEWYNDGSSRYLRVMYDGGVYAVPSRTFEPGQSVRVGLQRDGATLNVLMDGAVIDSFAFPLANLADVTSTLRVGRVTTFRDPVLGYNTGGSLGGSMSEFQFVREVRQTPYVTVYPLPTY